MLRSQSGHAQSPQHSRSRSALGGDIVGVVELAGLQAQTAAADAAVEIVAQRLQLRDPPVEAFADRLADLPPVEARRRAPLRQAAQMVADLVEREAEFLHDQDETQPPDIAAQKAALVARGAVRLDQPLILVEADRRGREAGAAREVADAEKVVRVHRFH